MREIEKECIELDGDQFMHALMTEQTAEKHTLNPNQKASNNLRAYFWIISLNILSYRKQLL